MNHKDTAVILAGGQSRRMGFDKQFLKIDDRWIIDLQIDKLKGLFKEIIIVTNKPEEYKDYPYQIIEDEIKDFGPLGGIHAALKCSNSYYNYVIACDMPCISMAYIGYMKQQIDPSERKIEAVITKLGEWVEPLNAFYSRALIGKIEENVKQEKKRIFELLQDAEVLYIEEKKAREFSANWDMFMNLNKPQDFEKYLSLIKGEV